MNMLLYNLLRIETSPYRSLNIWCLIMN